MDKIRMGIILFLLLTSHGCRRQDEVGVKSVKDSAAQIFIKQIANMSVITSLSNQKKKTQSVLYGNEAALENARRQSSPREGGMLFLLSWNSKSDAEWFGGIVPADVISLEVVQGTVGDEYQHSRFLGKDLQADRNTSIALREERKSFIITQKAAVMP